MIETFNRAFAAFKGKIEYFTSSDSAAVTLGVAGGSYLHLGYWRLVVEGRAILSWLDHGDWYGRKFDAGAQLHPEVLGRQCLGITVDPTTGDLLVRLDGDRILVGFRLTQGFEDWEVKLPDGEAFWSNYAFEPD